MRKAEVEHHSIGYGGRSVPAVNVKVHDASDWAHTHAREVAQDHGADAEEVAAFREFCADMEERHDGGSPEWLWLAACEGGWEDLQTDAEAIWPDRAVKVYAEGRCGGWAYVDGIPEFESWDAIELGRWARFARWARATADSIPRIMCDLVYLNDWEREREERAEEASAEEELALARY